jgi:hypothetical protein
MRDDLMACVIQGSDYPRKVMAIARLFPFSKNWLCCTGYEVVTLQLQVPNSPGGPIPLNVSCPAGKFMLDYEPHLSDPSGLVTSALTIAWFVNLTGSVNTTTLPDGRVLPTGWTGSISANVPGAGGGPAPSNVTVGVSIRCIAA